MENRLHLETSPYLQLHKENPVHWQPWDEEALALARDTNKPILLSIGYSACHWCHVMAEESFDDLETAGTMNQLYINIKVDREERPDLDNIYQSALANMGQQRGWPLTMFLTPDGEPFNGGTYFPPTPRQGMPSFKQVLLSNAEAYVNDPQQAQQQAINYLAELTATQPQNRAEITPEFLNHAANHILDGMDVVYGGFGVDAKFPQTMLLDLLWQAYCRTGHGPFREAVLRSAEHMCLGGIFDQLGGGFARYTIDDRWSIPHFEKMLYDNALIIPLLVLVWRETRSPLFAHCVELSANWMMREMQIPEGGFVSSLAADSEAYGDTKAGEGAFYVWTESEIDAVLGDNAILFKKYYEVTADGNWENGKSVLNRTDHPQAESVEVENLLAQCRQKLLQVRDKRPLPQRDDKILADWNGLAIAALAQAGMTFNRQDWIDSAISAFAFVQEKMSIDGTLRHAWRQGKCIPMAVLDDYANMAHAAIILYETSSSNTYLEQARNWVAIADLHYWDSNGGGYFFTADNAESIILRCKTATETATPSGNSMMVSVLTRLYFLTSEAAYRQAAEDTIAAFGFEAQSHYVAMASLLNHSEQMHNLLQFIVVSNAQQDNESQLFMRAIYEASIPPRLVLNITSGQTLPKGHPAYDKTVLENSNTTVYVCTGNSCQPPVTGIEALQSLLDELSVPLS